MTVHRALPIDAFVLDKAAAMPESETFFHHYFRAGTYMFSEFEQRSGRRCAECGQVRPRQDGDGIEWVEFGLCPAELERPSGWIRQQRSRIQEMQARIYRLQEVVRTGRDVLVAYNQGTLAPRGIPLSTMYEFERALDAAGDGVWYEE